jgi:hypothetical protein
MRSWKRSWKAHNVRGAQQRFRKKIRTHYTPGKQASHWWGPVFWIPLISFTWGRRRVGLVAATAKGHRPGVLHPLRATACCSVALLFKRTTNTDLAKPSPRLCLSPSGYQGIPMAMAQVGRHAPSPRSAISRPAPALPSPSTTPAVRRPDTPGSSAQVITSSTLPRSRSKRAASPIPRNLMAIEANRTIRQVGAAAPATRRQDTSFLHLPCRPASGLSAHR